MVVDRVAIIGGGVSGLASAYFLSQRGIRVTLIEKTNRTGGLIRTDFVDGCRLEAGPDSYIATKPAVNELAQELPGLKDQIIGSNDAARRIFVVRDGVLEPMPKGMVMMVPSEWEPLRRSPLVSELAKQIIAQETEWQPLTRTEDIPVGQLIREHFNEEVLEYLTEPLLSGVYGGDADKLSAESVLPRFMGYERDYGSLVRGVQQEVRDKPKSGSLFLSLRDGMQTLTDSLTNAIRGSVDIVRGEATAVVRDGDGWQVRVGAQTINASHVVLCCPAYVNAQLLEHSALPVAEELAAIPYSSAITVMAVYDRSALSHPLDGFGFLVPRGERKTLAAGTWVNTKFPSRIREGLAALRGFIVGKQAVELLESPEAEILSLIREDYRKFMGVTAEPLSYTLYKWPKSMPQYVVGHNRRVGRIWESLSYYKGLNLVGNAYDGVGIPDCVRQAKQLAQQIGKESV